jgi:hypothetical protein
MSIDFFEPDGMTVNSCYLRRDIQSKLIIQNGAPQIDWTVVVKALEKVDPLVSTSDKRKSKYQDVVKHHRMKAKTHAIPDASMASTAAVDTVVPGHVDIGDFFTPSQIIIIEAIVDAKLAQIKQELQAEYESRINASRDNNIDSLDFYNVQNTPDFS